MIVDACRGDMWAQSVPSNVSVIGANFTSCLSCDDRIACDDGPIGSLLQWAIDSALKKHHKHGGEWLSYLLECWHRIRWHSKEDKQDAKLVFHNIEPWIDMLPSFYSKYMEVNLWYI